MIRKLLVVLALVACSAGAYGSDASTDDLTAPTVSFDTVLVAPPTGDRESDRASIVAALERVRPGGTVQFASGTYFVGEYIQVSIPRLTFLGHPTGTTLRGCDPAGYEEMEREFADFIAAGGVSGGASLPDVGRCGILELTGGQQTVRGLTFEHSYWGLILGCCHDGGGYRVTDGGHLVEGNTFQSSMNGIRAGSDWPEPSLIRGNRFIDVHSPIGVLGRTFNVLNNEISVREPDRVIFGHPGVAIAFGAEPFAASCEGNVVAGNRIDGHPDGILLYIRPPGRCRDNTIRDNTIVVRRVWLPASSRGFWVDFSSEDDRSVVGVPLSLQVESGEGGILADNLIEGNRIIGGEGVAIEVLRAARTRIVNNTITGITIRDPFPGNTLWGEQERWRDANGSGIWVSPGSHGNEVVGNTFEDIASHAVFLEGDSNHVEVRDAADAVRDLGSGNRVATEMVSGPDAEVSGEAAYESKFVEARGVRLHYLDFGGKGLPVIFVHDWYEDAHTWTSFAPLFADAYRVLAMTRRGYGESDDVGWGYDVSTQSEDILSFMDALGIERAVLVGRHPTTQDMTWIAEHHPARLAGLVYLYHAIAPSPGEGRMLRDRTFAEMMMRYGGCWMGEEAYHRSAPRLLYRPHYIDDPERRIEVPAISFTHPQDFAAGAGDIEFLDLTLQMATGVDPGGGYCDPAAIRTSVDYLTALANDPERLAEVRPLVPTSEERQRYAEAFERAFGPNLRIVRLEQPANYRTDPEPYHARIRTFLGELARREAARAVDPARGPRVVHVAPPTGEQVTDRASILAALAQAGPGDVIQFAPGTYVLGEIIPIETAQLTILGHVTGTTLRGCDPRAYERMERDVEAAGDDQSARNAARLRCGVFEMTGGFGTIRGLTIEYTWIGLALGEKWIGVDLGQSSEPRVTDGGYLVENNVFRNSANGVRPGTHPSSAPTVISGNRFMNLGHAVSAGGPTHVLDNDISVPDPQSLLSPQGPLFAIGISRAQECIVEGNRIEGHPVGIALFGSSHRATRHNVIRDNTVHGVSFPLVLWGEEGMDGIVIEDNLIERNRITGAVGMGIALNRASSNRILDNTISGIEVRDSSFAVPFDLGEGNGSGIWVSPGSDGNEIVGNTFEDIAAFAVVLEGDGNRVELSGAADAVRDLGSGNRVSGPDTTPAPPAYESRFVEAGGVRLHYLELGGESPQDTIRHTVIVAGEPAGERLSWEESPGTWRYSARGPPSGFRRTSRIVFDAEGLPLQMEISGQKNPVETWEERFHLRAGRATWSTPVDEGEVSFSGPAYYAAVHPAHDLGVLARALLRRPTGVLPLLPAGEARLEPRETRVVKMDGRDRTIRLYAVHGLDLRPRHVWLDDEEATFADEWSVLAGWEAVFPMLRAAIGDAIADRMRRMARDLAPPARGRPLVIRGARLFDPETHAVHSGTTIIVEGSRILVVGPDDAVDIPADAEVVDATGRMVLPGLWDMHAHQDSGRYLEWYVPLHLAAGVTTTRDMGSDASMLVSLRQRIDDGEVIGPRIVMAGFIEGLDGSRTGIQVEGPADVLAAVDRYAGLGFVQLKIYNRLPADLVPVAIERAKLHGMRVSGHVPWEMTGREAVESGFNEIQHMTVLMDGMVLSPDEDLTDSEIATALAGLTPGSELVREFIGVLAANDVAVDPTLAFFHSTGAVPPTWIADVLDRLPPQAWRRWLDRSAPLWAGERWSEILANQFGIVRALHKAGVPILPGTDMMAGFGLHKELELYVEAGIPAPQVLTLATLGAARVMGMDDELGSIEPGKLADLILVDGDPTQDISDIRRVVTVIKDGRVYDPAAIYRALAIGPCCDQ